MLRRGIGLSGLYMLYTRYEQLREIYALHEVRKKRTCDFSSI